jgi:DNA invertase Pin-like site-specific DNA recombinase
MSDKITERHLARRAVLYVRQSTQHQVQHNEESRRLQYAMEGRLHDLGWRDVEIIDEDLGKSAGGTVERSGFQRLVSEVSLGKVGAVSARELSRLARNSADWQRLMEVCRYVDTLLVDHDAIYDIRKANDRLLLGLKGNMNEYELDLLRVRALEARVEKARRGELYARVAVGYRKTVDGLIEKHPDARVQHAMRLVFTKFLELGSARQVLMWMQEHGIETPVNRSDRGDVLWKRASYGWLHMVLTNPVYAGSYVYGRTMSVASMTEEGSIRRRVARKPGNVASVLLHDQHDGYIDREVFDRIQTMITANSQSRRHPGPGAPRIGQALLAGLLRCRRCGAKLVVNYSGTKVRVHRYECSRANIDRGEARCINFSGVEVDDRVVELVLQVVQPAAIEASEKLTHDDLSQCDAAVEALSLELKAARYAADRAHRQYDTAEPENRLVVDELERRWNAALERVRMLEARLDTSRVQAERPRVDVARFASLGDDVARIWRDPTTDVRLKKRIMRTLIEEVVVNTTEREISLVVHWKGGIHTELNVLRRRRGQNRMNTSPESVEAIRLLARVCSDDLIARALNASGVKTTRENRWTRELVRSFRSTHKIAVHSAADDEEWITLARAAELASVADLTLKRAIERGVVSALRPVSHGPWILSKAELLRSQVLERITKKPRARPRAPGVPISDQLTLIITRT